MDDLTMPDLGVDWAKLWAEIQTTGVDIALNFAIALLIFFVGKMIAKSVTKGLHTVLQKNKTDPILESFVCNLAYWTMMIFIIIAAINQVGIQTTSLIAIMGAASLAIGLALQGALANFAAGVLVVIFRPYREGDYIEAAGVAGSVVQVQILTTILKTGDNKQIVVPNGQIMTDIITNYSANDTRRIDMVVGVSYEDNLDTVRKTLADLVAAESRILADPECLIAVAELADSSVNFYLRPWVKSGDYWGVKFDLTEAIKKRFDKEGISFPFPQQDVHLYKEGS